MANVTVYNMEGNEVGTMELNDAVFGVEINEHLVHLAVVRQLANNRQGTQKAKTRSEVSGGGRKPWRQKGTGHARQGSIRAPQWTGGGVVFAPVPRDYEGYTPVALSLVGGWLGYSIIILQWGTTIFGILYKIFAKKINEKFSLFLYLMMGWLVIFIIPAIVTKTGPAFWGLMLAGGLSYTVGAAFYAKKKPYFHMIWHLFIMLASALQYLGIVYFMLP